MYMSSQVRSRKGPRKRQYIYHFTDEGCKPDVTSLIMGAWKRYIDGSGCGNECDGKNGLPTFYTF